MGRAPSRLLAARKGSQALDSIATRPIPDVGVFVKVRKLKEPDVVPTVDKPAASSTFLLEKGFGPADARPPNLQEADCHRREQRSKDQP
jgi:hypothetical protein